MLFIQNLQKEWIVFSLSQAKFYGIKFLKSLHDFVSVLTLAKLVKHKTIVFKQKNKIIASIWCIICIDMFVFTLLYKCISIIAHTFAKSYGKTLLTKKQT